MARKQMAWITLAALTAGLLGGLLANHLVGAAQANPGNKLVVNDGILLVDDQGRVRAELAFRATNGSLQPGLFLYSEDGRERAAITTLPPDGRPGVALSDAKGQTRLWLGLDPQGGPTVSLYDQGDQLRAALGNVTLRATPQSPPEQRPTSSLVLVNQAGRVVWSAP